MQKFAEVHFSAQKRLKFAKLLKNIEVSSKMLQNKPSKYIHLRTSLSACKIKKKSLFLATYLFWLGWLDSNQRMTVSKTVALPLGDSPIWFLDFWRAWRDSNSRPLPSEGNTLSS